MFVDRHRRVEQAEITQTGIELPPLRQVLGVDRRNRSGSGGVDDHVSERNGTGTAAAGTDVEAEEAGQGLPVSRSDPNRAHIEERHLVGIELDGGRHLGRQQFVGSTDVEGRGAAGARPRLFDQRSIGPRTNHAGSRADAESDSHEGYARTGQEHRRRWALGDNLGEPWGQGHRDSHTEAASVIEREVVHGGALIDERRLDGL